MRRIFITLAIPFLLLLVQTKGAAAFDVVVTIDDGLLQPSAVVQTGSFEIYVAHDEPTPPSLAGFQLLLTIFGAAPTTTKARFTSVETPTGRDYAFAPNSAAPIGSVAADGSSVQIGDFLLSGLAEIVSGEALAKVNYEIEAGLQPGELFNIQISTDPNDSFLAIDGSQRIDFSVRNATLGSTPVPEPGSAFLLATCGVLLGSRRRRR